MSAFTEAAKRNQKPRPRLLDKRDADAKTAKIDLAQNKIVKTRSGGQCEVIEHQHHRRATGVAARFAARCHRRAVHIHHLISGLGRRNVGRSIMAAHKLHVCTLHHSEIHGHVLKPISEDTRYRARTVCYERVE